MIRWLILGVYLVINIAFYPTLWRQLWQDDSVAEARYGEVLATEWSMEQAYQNLIKGIPFLSKTLSAKKTFQRKMAYRSQKKILTKTKKKKLK